MGMLGDLNKSIHVKQLGQRLTYIRCSVLHSNDRKQHSLWVPEITKMPTSFDTRESRYKLLSGNHKLIHDGEKKNTNCVTLC